MKRFIHRGYFLEIFTQLRTAGIVMASILMLFNVAPLFTNITALLSHQLPAIPSSTSLAIYMILYIYVAGLVLTFMSYNWLNHRSTSDFYHALPIKRSRIYWSSFLAVTLWIVIAITGYAIVHALLYLLTGMPFNYLNYLCVYLNMLIGVIQVVGVISLACALSGTRFVNLFSAIVILLVPRALLLVLALFVKIEAAYLPVLRMFFLFDPSYNIFATPYMSLLSGVIPGLFGSGAVSYTKPLAMLYSLAHACLLAFLGCIAFKVRASEAAGMPMRNRIIHGAIRTAFGLPLLLILVLMLSQEYFLVSATVVLVLFAFAFYCLYELISTKSAKRMLLSMPLFMICVGIAALYLFIPKLIDKAAASVKANSDNIVSFSLVGDGETFNSYNDMCETSVEIDDARCINIISRAYRRTLDPANDVYGSGTLVRIRRNNGRDILRYLQLTSGEEETIENAIEKTEPFSAVAREFPKGLKYYGATSLNAFEAREIANLFKEEYETLNENERKMLKDWDRSLTYSSHLYRSYYTLTIRGARGTVNYTDRIVITDLTPKTAQRYAEILFAKYNEHSKDEITEYISRMENKDGILTNIRIGDHLSMPTNLIYDQPRPLKDTNPEYYEILEILLHAEPTANAAEGATVTFGDTVISSFYDDAMILPYLNMLPDGQTCLFLKLSDEDLQHIEELLERHQQRYQAYLNDRTY